MRDALARKYYDEDEYETDECNYQDKPSQTRIATKSRRNFTQHALPFTVVAPTVQDFTDIDPDAILVPESTYEDFEVEFRPSLPTNGAEMPRQWTSGFPSGAAAPSSFAGTSRSWEMAAPEANSFQILPAPTYSSTLRPRRSPKRPVQVAVRNQIVAQRPFAEEISESLDLVRQTVADTYAEFVPRSRRAKAATTYAVPPALPTFGEVFETSEPSNSIESWLRLALEWAAQNKYVGGLLLVGLVVMVLVMSGGLSFLHNNDAHGQVLAFGDVVSSGTGNGNVSLSAGNGDVLLSAPSISPQKIDQVLSQYHSPATGTGQAMYDLGRKYGIDPAFALAFFIHESSAGTQGVAAVTKSIGNIRVTPGYEDYAGFRKYPTWEAGIEDWFKLIKNLYIDGWHLTTLQTIIPRYAPSADHNDPNSYINHVHNLVAGWRNGK